MFIKKIDKEKLQVYIPVYINRQTGEMEEADYCVSLYPTEVIERQINLSTVKTVVQFKKKV